MSDAAQTAATLFNNSRNLTGAHNNEANTISQLINPVLEYLGYPAPQQSREAQQGGDRTDIVLYDVPLALAGNRPAAAILEAKRLGHDLYGRNVARSKRPTDQLLRYMQSHDASGYGTYGFLTDGNIWWAYRRISHDEQPRQIQEWRLLDGSRESCAQGLAEIKELLAESTPEPVAQSRLREVQKAREICKRIGEGASPQEILNLLIGKFGETKIPPNQIRLSSKAAQAERDHWRQYAFAPAGRIKAEQGDTSRQAACVAVVRAADARDEHDAVLHRDDVAIAASLFAKDVPLKISATLMIQPDENAAPAAARLAVHYQGHTGMTTEFDPRAPAPKTLRTIQAVYDLLNKKTAADAQALADAVAAKGVRKRFFEKLANGWTLRQHRKAKGSPKQIQAHHEAALRHLIRTIFVWILKEDGKLPPEAFDEAFAKREAPGKYHADILTFLFHERLNQPLDARKPHPNPRIQQALADARFLNGSLFAEHENEDALDLTDDDYFSADPAAPGLFTILAEYDWTSSEHTPYHSDQSIDPEVLSNLFENLIAATKHTHGTPDRMPAGTYYTPADVALEMVKDALAEAALPVAPPTWTRADLRLLFGSQDELPPPIDALTNPERDALVERIRNLTIYDPAVGSGEFPFLCALALRDALSKLGVPDDNAALTRDIIARQLFAQDINPMAAQVTRLRLFIAIIAAENHSYYITIPPSSQVHPPLPNLEAKIVCADTLATVAIPGWSPLGEGTLQAGARAVNAALLRVAAVREQWQSAHSETRKAELRRQDNAARQNLRAAMQGEYATPETTAFADHALLDPNAPPAKTDPRLLFYDPDRRGFDIVIGNPPYESIRKSLQDGAALTATELANRRKDFNDIMLRQKRCQTLKGGDLYDLIAEAALSLANPDGGIVTLIVPLSICFGQYKQALRRLFENRCRRINLRNQDIRPDKTFHDSPVAHPSNSQRTTIITATTGAEDPLIEISATSKWQKSERHEYFAARANPIARLTDPIGDERIDSQWERIPTPEIQNLIAAMRAEKTKISNMRRVGENPFALAFPPSARYFITATPAGRLNRRERTLPIANQESLELAIAAANTHAAYAWWTAYGDAFDVNPHEIATIAIPKRWLEHEQTNRRARELGRALIAAINPANISAIVTGTKSKTQDSLNFHASAPAVIAELDALYLAALGQPQAALSQLHTLRGNTTWRLGAQAAE